MESESDLSSCIISITKKQATPSRAAEIDWFSLQIVSSKFCEVLLVYGTSLFLGPRCFEYVFLLQRIYLES